MRHAVASRVTAFPLCSSLISPYLSMLPQTESTREPPWLRPLRPCARMPHCCSRWPRIDRAATVTERAIAVLVFSFVRLAPGYDSCRVYRLCLSTSIVAHWSLVNASIQEILGSSPRHPYFCFLFTFILHTTQPAAWAWPDSAAAVALRTERSISIYRWPV